MVTFLAFVRPALLRMMGCTANAAAAAQGAQRGGDPQEARPHRIPARHRHTAPDGSLQVRTTGNQGSGVLSSMVQANGLIVLHHAQGNVAAGDAVDVMMFDGVIEPPRLPCVLRCPRLNLLGAALRCVLKATLLS